jgi:hypothetical protein
VASEVLADNGSNALDGERRIRPTVLFERCCSNASAGNGVTTRLTKPRSPTTTGKIEQFHNTLRREPLDAARPFPSGEAADLGRDRRQGARLQPQPAVPTVGDGRPTVATFHPTPVDPVPSIPAPTDPLIPSLVAVVAMPRPRPGFAITFRVTVRQRYSHIGNGRRLRRGRRLPLASNQQFKSPSLTTGMSASVDTRCCWIHLWSASAAPCAWHALWCMSRRRQTG